MNALLDNIVWNALAGPQRNVATGTHTARRYARGFSPIVGFADPVRPDFASLGPYVDADEHFYCDGWSGPAPRGWTIESESTMFKMVFDGEAPSSDPAPDAVRLGASHAAAALALATLTRPGPFGPRTIELGEYFGYFEDGRLIAMAGERMHAGQLREISGVCVHPDYQRRGLARRLMSKLVLLELARRETPFLHAMSANEGARILYRSLGFRDYRETVVRVVTRSAQSDGDAALEPTARA